MSKNIFKISALACLLLAVASVSAAAKTTVPQKVASSLVNTAPYRFNGVVTTDEGRGSGFCAWNKQTFFSAAHVVFDDESLKWLEPPLWYGKMNAARLTPSAAVRSRGYFRWTEYAKLVDEDGGLAGEAFGQDVILGFAFKDLIQGPPARLNLNGMGTLRTPVRAMMTGYPAEIAYNDKPTKGYFLHRTGPFVSSYKRYSGMALETTLISSGPGNSGGPIWTPAPRNSWVASGVVVGGLPSESIVYAFSKETNAFLRAVTPVLTPGVPESIEQRGVESSSRFFSSNLSRVLPDGVHKWTDYSFNVDGFPTDAVVTSVKISLNVKTSHRGDLQILLTAPGGYSTIIHNEQGGPRKNLVIRNRNVSEDFLDIPVKGRWMVRFQDRLKGDISTVRSVTLEIASDGGSEAPTP